MRGIKRSLTISLPAFVILLSMAGCATHTQIQDVGAVVVAPAVQVPPVPAIVQTTEPKPAGYFQQTLLDFFNGSR